VGVASENVMREGFEKKIRFDLKVPWGWGNTSIGVGGQLNESALVSATTFRSFPGAGGSDHTCRKQGNPQFHS
jgi:hypothetical protein